MSPPNRNATVTLISKASRAATRRMPLRPTRKPGFYKKAEGHASQLCYMGHVMIENGNGLFVASTLTHATGTAEREAACAMVDGQAGHPGETLAWSTIPTMRSITCRQIAPTAPNRCLRHPVATTTGAKSLICRNRAAGDRAPRASLPLCQVRDGDKGRFSRRSQRTFAVWRSDHPDRCLSLGLSVRATGSFKDPVPTRPLRRDPFASEDRGDDPPNSRREARATE